MITIIDLKIGNVGSVGRALQYLGVPHHFATTADEVFHAKKIILPGVGNFAAASNRLQSSGLMNVIASKVNEEKSPILGICLGMQLLARTGFEGGLNPGLDLINAEVKEMKSRSLGLRLPHMGWNHLSNYSLRLLRGVKPGSCFYFVHSYEVLPKEPFHFVTTEYGSDVVAMVEKEHIFGCQFHPEKSQESGLLILKNFAEI